MMRLCGVVRSRTMIAYIVFVLCFVAQVSSSSSTTTTADEPEISTRIDNIEECLDCTEASCLYCESEHQFTPLGQHFSMCNCETNEDELHPGYCGRVYAQFNRYATSERQCILGNHLRDDGSSNNNNEATMIAILAALLPIFCCLGFCSGCSAVYYIYVLKQEAEEERRLREQTAMMKVVTARQLMQQPNNNNINDTSSSTVDEEEEDEQHHMIT